MTALAILRKDAILPRVAKGDHISDIAHDLGLADHSAISKALAKDPDYQAARETGAEARIEQREKEMELAADSVTVARTRELLSHARWRAEREFPDRWGQRQQDRGIQVSVVLSQQVGNGAVQEQPIAGVVVESK